MDPSYRSIDGPFASIDGPFVSIDGPFVSIDGPFVSIDGPFVYEAPYRTKLIFFYRRDVFHSDSHFTNRNDGFYLSQWWTLLIELKVSIISIAFLSIDRCTHRNFHIDRTITKHRLIDLMYRSIDTKGPSIDTKGPSIDTKGPSIDAKGPSIDRYEGSIAIDTKGPS